MCGKDRNNRTIIFAEGLWLKKQKIFLYGFYPKQKNIFKQTQSFIDADPALISAVETVYPFANLKLCG